MLSVIDIKQFNTSIFMISINTKKEFSVIKVVIRNYNDNR